MARGLFSDDVAFHGFAHPSAVGRGGVLPAPALPDSTDEIHGIDLTHTIYTSDVAHGGHLGYGAAKGGGGKPGGGGGGGGGGMTFADYTSGPSDPSAGFNITIQFSGTWTQALHDIFVAAADYYTSLISGDLANVSVRNRGQVTTVDDITISASLTNIDGVNGILGQAGPTSVRTSNSLPATATMEFDVADADAFNQLGLFDDIVLHEMGHSLGFGSIWDRLGLVANGLFTGSNAKAESLDLFGTDQIFVEQDGGSGTAGSHWDEETYDNELMTGYINDANYMSTMSGASFADLGYQLSSNWQQVVADLPLVAA